MNKNTTLLLLFIIPLLLLACNQLEDVSPSDFLSTDELFTTVADLQSTLTGAYGVFEEDAVGGEAS